MVMVKPALPYRGHRARDARIRSTPGGGVQWRRVRDAKAAGA